MLLRELIEIPERVHEDEFVLKLSDGITRPAETLHSYIVTDQLVGAFDAALSLVGSALKTKSSKGAFLHGSFGSGKSHFMAVLHQILKHDPAARSIGALASVVKKHDGWLEGRRLLLVPYHLIGAKNLESAVLGGYAEYVRRLHPGSTPPAVFLSTSLFHDASGLRTNFGDGPFFAKLNASPSGAGASAGWGTIGPRWDAGSFERAMSAEADERERKRLVADLVTAFFPGHAKRAVGIGEGFVTLDEGLAAMSQHARSLGYDAVVLFLDELILWLASNIGNLHLVETESAKLVKLVESGPHERPAQIVSFVARQRDLKELVGEHVAGAEKLSFGDALRYMKDRFAEINLEDRNLPEIIQGRLLRPRDGAEAVIDQEFEKTKGVRQEVLRVLLGREGDTGAFRRLYPFSPALVQTLVALSSVLQRNRTALRLLQQLLVRQRETLALGDIVPVGDLFDELEAGVEPFSHEMRTAYEEARKIYRQRFRPILLSQHKLTEDELRALPRSDGRARGFRGDDRIVKTLLIAALVPEVEALKEMRASRLSALNHGSIRAPIAGQEAQLVLSKCEAWAAQEGTLRIGDERPDPTITLQVAGVDVDGILEKALGEDNEGNKRAKLRDTLYAELGITPEPSLVGQTIEYSWRGTKRAFEITLQNVREMSDEALRPGLAPWKIVFDFPFDAAHGPKADESRIAAFRARGESVQTVCWLPSFLGARALADLGRLVRVEHVLGGARLRDDYARELSELDRAAARGQLENMRSTLRLRLKLDLEMAYGLRSDVDPNRVPDPLDAAEHLRSLAVELPLKMTPGATLRDSFNGILEQALAFQFPGHPEFLEEVKPATCAKVLDSMRRALEDPNGRLEVEPGPMRATLRDVAMPLKLGTAYPSHFIVGAHWSEFFERSLPKEGPVTVERLRSLLDQPPAMGLPRPVQDLVILFYAERAGKTVAYATGAQAAAEIGKLADDMILKDQPLPVAEDWSLARDRAARVFGVDVPKRCSPANVATLVDAVRRAAVDHAPGARELVAELEKRTKLLGIAPGDSDRLRVSLASLDLAEALRKSDDRSLVATLAKAGIPVSLEAAGASLTRSGEAKKALAETHWEVFDSLADLPAPHGGQGADLLQRLREAMQHTENALRLAPRLHELEGEAIRLKNEAVRAAAPPAPIAPAPIVPVPASAAAIEPSGKKDGLDSASVRSLANGIAARLEQDPTLAATVSWSIAKKS